MSDDARAVLSTLPQASREERRRQRAAEHRQRTAAASTSQPPSSEAMPSTLETSENPVHEWHPEARGRYASAGFPPWSQIEFRMGLVSQGRSQEQMGVLPAVKWVPAAGDEVVLDKWWCGKSQAFRPGARLGGNQALEIRGTLEKTPTAGYSNVILRQGDEQHVGERLIRRRPSGGFQVNAHLSHIRLVRTKRQTDREAARDHRERPERFGFGARAQERDGIHSDGRREQPKIFGFGVLAQERDGVHSDDRRERPERFGFGVRAQERDGVHSDDRRERPVRATFVMHDGSESSDGGGEQISTEASMSLLTLSHSQLEEAITKHELGEAASKLLRDHQRNSPGDVEKLVDKLQGDRIKDKNAYVAKAVRAKMAEAEEARQTHVSTGEHESYPESSWQTGTTGWWPSRNCSTWLEAEGYDEAWLDEEEWPQRKEEEEEQEWQDASWQDAAWYSFSAEDESCAETSAEYPC